MRKILVLLTLLLIAGCAAYSRYQLDQRFGVENPARFDQALSQATAPVEYWRDVKPITDSRCAVCHGCFDAPCQLQMGSYDGITRGANKDKVYDALRLSEAEPTRLFVDSGSNAEWRLKGFYPVLNERDSGGAANVEASVMARMLKLKRQHSVPSGSLLPKDRYDFSLDRDQRCPAIEAFDQFAEDHPEWGMPYGLPTLANAEQDTLLRWLQAGAPAAAPLPPVPAQWARVAQWEAFLNGDSLKAQLTARYIYEHWFLAHLYFDDLPQREFFELVRSRTPPGQPVDLIAARRPFEDPGVSRVYYRLRPVRGTLLAKTHMPYALNAARLARLQAWFIDAPYSVEKLPSYAPAIAANPFVAFEPLPLNARYRLMLEDAQFTLMGFIKGPVCRGQVALNVISDIFWVGFVNPEAEVAEGQSVLVDKLKEVRLPTDQPSISGLLDWHQYSQMESGYLHAKSKFLNQKLVGRALPKLEMLWNGDGANPGAALTVFRHFDSASVVQGFVGRPQTALIMGYPILERMHYLLVAGFDVYGTTAHQLEARLYMDFLRMEGEFTVLAFLPKTARNAVRDQWYRDATADVKAYLNGSKAFFYQDSGIAYQTAEPWPEFLDLWKQYMKPVLGDRYELSSSRLAEPYLGALRQLAELQGLAVSRLPEASFLAVHDERGQEHIFTVLRNSAHSNISTLFKESDRRRPGEDTLTVVPGFIGAYPNAFYRLEASQLADFARRVAQIKTEADYTELSARYAIRRTDRRFWRHSDLLHAAYREAWPVEAGLFDYNRVENR